MSAHPLEEPLETFRIWGNAFDSARGFWVGGRSQKQKNKKSLPYLCLALPHLALPYLGLHYLTIFVFVFFFFNFILFLFFLFFF